MVTRHEIPFTRAPLDPVVALLLQRGSAAAAGDLSGALVLVPARRAAVALQHRLLELSGRSALLLPEITLIDDLAARLGTAMGLEPVPAALRDPLRATLLASRLRDVPWAGGAGDASAAGFATELVKLFDDLRRYGPREGPVALLEQGGADPAVVPPQEAEVYQRDCARIRAAWRAYRDAVPRDRVDLLREVDRRLARDGWPGRPPELVVVAHFARLDPVAARLVRHALAQGEGHVFVPLCRGLADRSSTDHGPTDRDPTGDESVRHGALVAALLATYEEAHASLRPDQPGRRVCEALQATETAEVPRLPGPESRSANGTAAFGDAAALTILRCADPEREAASVAAVVVERLQQRDAARVRIGVATPDRQLAARIIAHLRDSGVDVDDSGGTPLAALPAGTLAYAILQAARSGLRPAELIDVLTHPYVDAGQGRRYRDRVLVLEKSIRRRPGGVPGFAALRRVAAAYDAGTAELARGRPRDAHATHGEGVAGGPVAAAGDRTAAAAGAGEQSRASAAGPLESFVEAIAAAFEPLDLRSSPPAASAEEWCERFAEVWNRLAPARPLLPREDESGAEEQDIAALAHCLGHFADVAERLPRQPFATWAADLLRILRREEVRPHRELFLPVHVTGLLEARLECYDFLVLAGLTDDLFPGPGHRPVFLNEHVRREIGLPGWRERQGEQAELFLRLLHNGRQVRVTYPREREGQPTLASSFLIRLELGRGGAASEAPPATYWRRTQPPVATLAAREESFHGEPAPAPLVASLPPVDRLSYSDLATFALCPYRWLLERRFGLRREEDVVAAFRSQDYGTQVHAAMRDFLAPAGRGQRAVAEGDVAAAAAALATFARRRIVGGEDELPQRRLWLRHFLDLVPSVVACEIERARRWRPLRLEVDFRLPLARLRDWIVTEAARLDEDPAVAAVTPDDEAVAIHGRIDRVDRRADGSLRAAVIDYKTGRRPGPRAVEHRDLQVVLYTVAVEQGALLDPAGAGSGPESGQGEARKLRVEEAFYYGLRADEVGAPPRGPHVDAAAPAGRRTLLAGARDLLALASTARDPATRFPLVPRHLAGDERGDLPCPHCAFLGACRLEERVLPPWLAIAVHRRPERIPGG